MLTGNPLYDFRVYSLLYFLTSVLALIFAGILGIKNRNRSSRILSFIFINVFLWSGANTFEAAANTTNLKEIWAVVSYLGTAFAPFFFFLFGYNNAYGITRASGRYLAMFAAIPTLFIFIAATNNIHKSLWPQIVIDPVTNLGTYSYGWLFVIFIAYQYIILTLGFFYLITAALKQNRMINKQMIIIVFAAIFPILGNLFYVLKLLPPIGFDWTPLSFWLSSFLLTYGILRFQILDVVPVARGRLIEAMSIGYVVTDTEHRIMDYNPAMLNILGIKPDTNLRGRQISEYISGCEAFDKIPGPLNAPKNEVFSEIHIGMRYVEIRDKPLLSSSGVLNGRLVMLQDVTRRKEAENEKEKYLKQLSAENQQNEMLIQELDAYAHTVAHDLKSPLASVIGFLYLMEDEIAGSHNPEVEKYHTLAIQSAEDLIHIIDELLLLATVRRESIGTALLDMQGIVEHVLVRLDQIRRDFSASITLPEKWPETFGYGPWIEEVWANYISNSLKYGGKPPVVTLGWDRDQSGNYRFWVEDNGLGVPPEKQNKLFKPDPGLAQDRHEVHGLGLSIVKRIIDRLGGKVGFESRPDGTSGTRFFFTLPPH